MTRHEPDPRTRIATPRSKHKKVNQIGTSIPLDLLHMDLVGPTRTESLSDKRYFLVVVDDFSRYTWVAFLREKLEAFDELITLCKRMQIEMRLTIKRIRSDYGRKLENHKFSN